jgi:predicted RNA binding protein YcfA (HicA-like mRNA interferase family)
MPKLSHVTARQMATLLEKLGFCLTRQSASHKINKNAVGKRATIPLHASKILHPKVLKSILRDAELSPEDLQRLL